MEIFLSSLPARIKTIRSKTTEKRWWHLFPHYKSTGAFCCHGNQSFDPICPKTLCSLSPTPVMLHIKFDQDLRTGLRDIQVWKCGQRRTDDGPLVFYKLTCEPSGSGELKMWLEVIKICLNTCTLLYYLYRETISTKDCCFYRCPLVEQEKLTHWDSPLEQTNY